MASRNRITDESQTKAWVRTNYTLQPMCAIHRRDMHDRYKAYCRANELQPVNLTSFDRILDTIFPDIRVRRLGGRGRSQYYYDGIRERNEDEMNARSLSTVRGGSSSPRTHPVQSPPLNIPKFNAPSIPSDRANQEVYKCRIIYFTTMYEKHCQEIFDMVLSCKVERIQPTMHSFYQDIPSMFKRLVRNTPELIDAIWRWDNSLYNFMINNFFSFIDCPLSTYMRHTLETYATKVEDWQKTCLTIFPEMLYQKKTDVAGIFSAKIRRQLSLNRAARKASSVLADHTQLTYMRQAWDNFDFDRILNQISPVYGGDTEDIRTLIKDVSALLDSHPAIKHWMDWVSTIVDQYLRQYSPSPNEDPQYVTRSNQLLREWTSWSTLITHALSLQQAEIFYSFDALRQFLCEYLQYLIEEIQHEQTQQGLQQNPDPSVPSTVETADSRNDSGNE